MNASATSSSPAQTAEKKRRTPTPARQLVDLAIRAALEKKATDIAVMDMTDVSGFADYFVLCTGDSDAQIKAITDGVQETIKEECGERAWHVEGYQYRQWVLIDYVDTVVHVFDKERREFYSLERLWADAPTWEVDDDTGLPQFV